MKVKKIVRHLKYNTDIRFYKENSEKVFAQCDSLYLLRNYPLDHTVYILMNYKIKSIQPGHIKDCEIEYINIIVEDK